MDVRRLALIGESAGGHLVSYVGAKASPETRVAAVVPFYAPHDLELQVHNRKSLGESMTALLGLAELNDDAWKALRAASPSTYIRPQMPPYLLVHGDKDPTVPYEQSVLMAQQLAAHKVEHELFTSPSGGHGFDRREGNEDSPEVAAAYARVIDFLCAHV